MSFDIHAQLPAVRQSSQEPHLCEVSMLSPHPPRPKSQDPKFGASWMVPCIKIARGDGKFADVG